MTVAQQEKNTARTLAEIYLVKLASLTENGVDGNAEYDRLCDNLGDLESRLTVSDVQFLRDLSSDLYMLETDEIYEGTRPDIPDWPSLKGAVSSRYRSGDWLALLSLLRQPAEELTAEARAFTRGMAYEALGSHAAAWAFFTHASQIAHDKPIYQYFALESLDQWNPDESLAQAQQYLNDTASHLAIKLRSASLILARLVDLEVTNREPIRELAIHVLPALGSAAHQTDVPREVVIAGYATLALCLEILEDFANAALVYRLFASSVIDGPVQARIAYMDSQVRHGRSHPSGILIDPHSIDLEQAIRMDRFDEVVDKSFSDLLAYA